MKKSLLSIDFTFDLINRKDVEYGIKNQKPFYLEINGQFIQQYGFLKQA